MSDYVEFPEMPQMIKSVYSTIIIGNKTPFKNFLETFSLGQGLGFLFRVSWSYNFLPTLGLIFAFNGFPNLKELLKLKFKLGLAMMASAKFVQTASTTRAFRSPICSMATRTLFTFPELTLLSTEHLLTWTLTDLLSSKKSS